MTPRKEPWLGPDELLDRLINHREQIKDQFPLRLTDRRLFLMVLAYRKPIGTVEVRAAVRKMTDSPYYPQIHRLVHGVESYRVLRTLRYRGVLRHERRGPRAFFIMQPGIRRAMRKALADIQATDARSSGDE